MAELPDACRDGLLGTAATALAAADMDRGLWGWVQEAQGKVTVTPMQADLLTGLERAVRERLHGLNDYDLSKLGPTPEATEAALRAWDESVSELWRTSLALTQAQKRVTRAHELLRDAISEEGS